jgi:hypothetical protein
MTGGSGGYTIDVDAVQAGAAKLSIGADQLEEAAKELQNALQAQGDCWGDDDSGKEFAKDYVPGSQGAIEGFANLVAGLRGLHQTVDSATKATQGTDQDIGSQLGKGL